MNNKNLLHALTIISLMFFSTAVSSCSEPISTLIMETENPIIQPGLTSELKYNLVFPEDQSRKPGRKEIKTFSEKPIITISNPDFKVLSMSPENSKDGISLTIIIRASEELLSGSSLRIDVNWSGKTTSSVIVVKKDPESYINADGIITDPSSYDAMINKVRRLPADYIPADLVRVEVPTILSFEEVNHLRRLASEALSAMFLAAEDEQGYELLARSGYRSYSTQVMLYDGNVREHGEEYASRFSARPGTSEHQSGLVMDISSPVVNYQLTQDFGDTDEGIWVADNAYRFGFIIRYLKEKEDITGYSYEPWHLRWVGVDLAEIIHSAGMTLEGYYNG